MQAHHQRLLRQSINAHVTPLSRGEHKMLTLDDGVCSRGDTRPQVCALLRHRACDGRSCKHAPISTVSSMRKLANQQQQQITCTATHQQIILRAAPFISPLGLTITPALSSKYMKTPSFLLQGFRCRTTTAGITASSTGQYDCQEIDMLQAVPIISLLTAAQQLPLS